jgi:DHA3 family tetracycline resistance protein-like MFS transporter
MAISLVGDGVYLVAIAWQVYELSNTPTALGLVGVATMVPTVVLVLLGGVVTDRFERRRVLIAADLVRGAAVAGIGVLAISGHLQLWHIFLLVACFGVGDALFGPAFRALVPEIVPADQLVQANALEQMSRPFVRLVGPAVGGLLVKLLGPGPAFLCDAASFGCSIAALLLLTPRPLEVKRARTPTAALGDLVDGFRFVRSQAWLWGTLALVLVINILGGVLFVLVPFIVKNKFHESAAGLGLLYACGAIGAVTGSLLLSQLSLPRRHVTVMYALWSSASLMAAGYAIVVHFWQALLVAFGVGFGITGGNVIWGALVGMFVPREMVGRVTSVDWLFTLGLVPAAYAFVGPVSNAVGVSETFAAAGLLGAVLPLCFLLVIPAIRDTGLSRPAKRRLTPTTSGP